jgi:hypothetical protein
VAGTSTVLPNEQTLRNRLKDSFDRNVTWSTPPLAFSTGRWCEDAWIDNGELFLWNAKSGRSTSGAMRIAANKPSITIRRSEEAGLNLNAPTTKPPSLRRVYEGSIKVSSHSPGFCGYGLGCLVMTAVVDLNDFRGIHSLFELVKDGGGNRRLVAIQSRPRPGEGIVLTNSVCPHRYSG